MSFPHSRFTDTSYGEGNARAAVVNRTHRLVRQRATSLRAKRSWVRGVVLPLILCSFALVALCDAVWEMFEQTELSATGTPEASSQIYILLLWFLPVSLVALGIVWLRGRESMDVGVAELLDDSDDGVGEPAHVKNWRVVWRKVSARVERSR